MIRQNSGNIMIAVLAVGLLLGLGFWYVVTQQDANPPETTPTISSTPTETTNDTSDWLTYQSEDIGVSFKYPKDWYVWSEDTGKSIIVSTLSTKDLEEIKKGPNFDFIKLKISKQDSTNILDIDGEVFSYNDLGQYGLETISFPNSAETPAYYISKTNTGEINLPGELVSIYDAENMHFMGPYEKKYFLLSEDKMVIVEINALDVSDILELLATFE
ncbi:hypothetical protein GW793_04350 [bacterium]|uniref:Uncharacterized protein n=1 Tax=candidate division WWE3 bacterium CG_4_9_14_3_um_filter_39_7 TaxID=1975080 RepID=A0A2M7X1W7_UNCKA|nr:hypothetical protein [bacterium]PJA40163.1 MAG: hypothetical protein CO179_03130 [candidate division WWE3 bacterium CG_4_9_14_3_um_filter_39_7]